VLAVYAFKFQIYCDFSGYSDMAIGIGRLLGFRLPINFRSPYKATSITNYWQRWHITLGAWFRDYVFYPMGGSRGSLARTCVNLLATMLLVGLWHGANTTFVLWGGYYGVLMCVERVVRRRTGQRPEPQGWQRVARVVWVFQLTAVGSLLFRALYLQHLVELVRALGRPAGMTMPAFGVVVWAVLAFAVVSHFLPAQMKERCEVVFCRLSPWAQAVVTVLVLVTLRLAGAQTLPFYYFQV